MKLPKSKCAGAFFLPALALGAVAALPFSLRAGEAAVTPTAPADTPPANRYGLFNWLDNRSDYGSGLLPEPFLVDDSDLEQNEARFDWAHSQTGTQRSDVAKAEFEKGFGPVTLEISIPYERDVSDDNGVSHGIGNINFGARTPFYQVVSDDGFIDSTFGVAAEIGFPVTSAISKNIEVVPKVFNDLVIGGHFSVQTVLGFSTVLGGAEEGGRQNFEYGFVFGYTFQHEELPWLPLMRQFTPVLELSGEVQTNQDDPGHDNLHGDIGFRYNLKAIGPVQPRLGAAFVFPVDYGARQDTDWGLVTSMVFEY